MTMFELMHTFVCELKHVLELYASTSCIISPNKQLLRLGSRFHLLALNSHLKRFNSLKPFKAASH